MSDVKIIDLGGSIIVPDRPDPGFLKNFHGVLSEYLEADSSQRIILVCGGGATAREYQSAYCELIQDPQDESQDWIGIAATRLNAELLRQIFISDCPSPVVMDPTTISVFPGRILVASGWKPGFSTDYIAVLLAEKFFSDTVINLSNIPKVYTADPKLDSEAAPLDSINWIDFKALIGDRWIPGRNVPFDPVAAQHAAEIGLKVIVAAGGNTENLSAILQGGDFIGTVIGPD